MRKPKTDSSSDLARPVKIKLTIDRLHLKKTQFSPVQAGVFLEPLHAFL